MSEEVFTLCPIISRCTRLSCLSGISSSTSIASLLLLQAVARDMAYFSTSKARSLPHCFFSLFNGKGIYDHHIWILHPILNLLIIWTEKMSSCIVHCLSAVLTHLAKYSHLSSIIVVQLDRFVFPALNGCRNIVTIKYLFKEGSVQDFWI